MAPAIPPPSLHCSSGPRIEDCLPAILDDHGNAAMVKVYPPQVSLVLLLLSFLISDKGSDLLLYIFLQDLF